MAELAHLASAEPLNRALESLAGSDTLFSRVGGLNGDPAAVALAALPPLELGALPEGGDALTSLPNLLDGAPLAGIADADLGSLLGSTSLAGGLPLGGGALGGGALGGGLLGGGSTGLGSLTGVVGSVVETATGALSLGTEYPTNVLGSVGDLLNGGDPATAVTNAAGAAVEGVVRAGSGAAMVVNEIGQIGEQPLTETLNGVVKGLHFGIESAAHFSGLNFALHGVTNLGETIGLGEIGGENLLTEVVNLPGALASGEITGAVEAVTGHLGEVIEASSNIVTGLTVDIGNALGHGGEGTGGGTLIENALGVLNGGDPLGGVSHLASSVGRTVDPLVSSVAGAVEELTGGLGENPVDALHGAVGELTAGLGTVGYATGLNHSLHSVANLLNSPGDLGGGDPLGAILPGVTDVVDGAVIDVETALGAHAQESVGSVLSNVSDILQGGDPLTGAANAVGNATETVGHLAGGAVGAIEAVGQIGEAGPIDTLNNVIDELHVGIEFGSHSLGLADTLHRVVNLGEGVGLGEIGGDNLVTDVVELPGALLGGGDPAASIGDIVDHVGVIPPLAEAIVPALVNDLTIASGGSLPLPGAGGGLPLPGLDALPLPGVGELPLPGVGGGSLPLPGLGGGADSLVGTIEDTVHAVAGGALPAPVAPIVGGDLDLGHPTDLGGLTDIVHTLPIGTPEHHSGGLGLGLI